MTTANTLLSRVRTNINEPSTASEPLRSDTEILQWLEDAQIDYIGKIGAENFPELMTSQAFSGGSVAIPADYIAFNGLVVNHTISGTYTGIEQAFVLGPSESYFVHHWPGAVGAWCQVAGSTISCGPSAIAGTLSYLKRPATISSTSVTFGLDFDHEYPVVCLASALACMKINDADSEFWMTRYNEIIGFDQKPSSDAPIERA